MEGTMKCRKRVLVSYLWSLGRGRSAGVEGGPFPVLYADDLTDWEPPSLHSNTLILGEANRPRTTQYVADECDDQLRAISIYCGHTVSKWVRNTKYFAQTIDMVFIFSPYFVAPRLAFQATCHPPTDNRKKNYSRWQRVNRSRNQVRNIPGNYKQTRKCTRKL